MRKLFILSSIVAVGLLSSCSEKEDIAIIHTDFGDITLLLFKETPLHKENFIDLAEDGFYDGTTFHRIIDNFMIQGGDPNSKDDDVNNDGIGGPGFTVPAEFNTNFTHVRGALAAARQPDNVNPEKASSGSQFYIVEPVEGYHPLDGNYTVFGQTINGMEVVEEIAIQLKDNRNRPINDIKMTIEIKSMTHNKIAEEYGYEFKPGN